MLPSRRTSAHLVLRLALLVAVLASAMLLVDYINAGDPAFCGAGSGCAAVRRSAFSHLGPLPLPAVGLLAELILLGMAAVGSDAAAALTTFVAAALGGVIALGLIVVQAFVVQAFCKWCLVVDLSTIVAAVAGFFVLRHARTPDGAALLPALSRAWIAVVWIASAVACAALPFLWGEYPEVPPLPAEVAARAVRGKLTLVTFTDFECPYCRRLAPVLHDAVASAPGKIALVRVMAPLDIHAGAMPAAIGYACAPEGKRDAMATALYQLPPDKLDADGVKGAAAQLGFADARYTGCVGAASTRQRIDDERRLFDKLDLEGLPYTFVGSRAVAGANPVALQARVEEALAGDHATLPVWLLFIVVAALAAGLVALTGRAAAAAKAPAG